MIKKSTIYKVICNGIEDKYVLADSFKEAEDIINQYLQNRSYNIVTIECISRKGDILYENSRTEN